MAIVCRWWKTLKIGPRHDYNHPPPSQGKISCSEMDSEAILADQNFLLLWWEYVSSTNSYCAWRFGASIGFRYQPRSESRGLLFLSYSLTLLTLSPSKSLDPLLPPPPQFHCLPIQYACHTHESIICHCIVEIWRSDQFCQTWQPLTFIYTSVLLFHHILFSTTLANKLHIRTSVLGKASE